MEEFTDQQIATLEAVKRDLFHTFHKIKGGLFTAHEMRGVIDCYRDDLHFLFNAIDKLKGAEKIEKLNNLKTRYQMRYDNSPIKAKHQHIKLFDFIDREIREAQKEHLTDNSKYKPLLLKDIAKKFGCSTKYISQRIKEFTKENKFVKKGKGRYFSIEEIKLLEPLLGCSLSETKTEIRGNKEK